MNLVFEQHYPHASRGSITQPLCRIKNKIKGTYHELLQLFDAQWPLHDLNFYVQLDHAITLWQELFYREMQILANRGLLEWAESDYTHINNLLDLWLKVVKKIEFYRLDGEFKELIFHPFGLYSLYEHGNMRSIYLLSEIEKYRSFDDATTLKELKKEEQSSIFHDVSLKIARHVLTELKGEMYLPGKQLMLRLIKLYGFRYDFSQSFLSNYDNAISDKQVISKQSRQASIVLFTLKIMHSLQTLEGLCNYLSYLKCILLDRNSGMLSAQYDLWTLLYQTCLRIYSRHELSRQKKLLQIDQILTSPLTDQQFQTFLLKHLEADDVSLSSINFYLKNSRKQQKQELKTLIMKKIQKLNKQSFWTCVEDIFQYLENQLEGEQRKLEMKKMVNKMFELPYLQVESKSLYEIQYGIAFLIENCVKYLDDELQLLGKVIVSQMLKIVRECKQSKHSSPSLVICFKLLNMFLGTIYLEIDHQEWKVTHTKQILELVDQFYSLGFICSKAALKFIYHLLSQEDKEDYWNKYFEILAQHYFYGGYDENSDLQIIHSHQTHKEVLAAKILQKFSKLASIQIIQNRELTALLEGETDPQVKQSFFAIRGYRDSALLEGIQNICLIFSSHLSVQTLQFSLNFVSAFSHLPSWRADEDEPSLLSLICEEMPIEILKFVYNEFVAENHSNWKELEVLPCEFWAQYWTSRKGVAKSLSSFKMDLEQIQGLQKLKRLQFIMDLANCVFDKLNQHSQKNIKQIKLIYEGGVSKMSRVLTKLSSCFLSGAATALVKKTQSLSCEQVKSLSLCGDEGSLIDECYLQTNNLLSSSKLFNQIGRVNESLKLNDFKKLLFPSFPQLSYSDKTAFQEAICRQLQIVSTIENAWNGHLAENQNIILNKDWIKQLIILLDDLKICLKKQNYPEKDACLTLIERFNEHVRGLLGRLVMPSVLTQLLMKDGRTSTKSLSGLMRSAIQLINSMDSEYEEHFISLIERLEDNLKDNNKGTNVQSSQILCLLQLMLELIFKGVRIRSYHLYRVIKYYQKASGQPPAFFNAIIVTYIRLCFEQFITNFKPTAQLINLSANKKNLSANHIKLSRQQIKLGTIQAACMLSMFINLFCRLNYPSLGFGVEKIFGEEEGKAMYIDYLTSLSRRIATQQTTIAPRQLQILKIDVYGNLSIITKNELSQRLLNKLISLAKHLLRVKIDMKGINKLPIKLLAEKLALEPLSLSLEEFQDQCKAISLGSLSVYRRMAKGVDSNLHLVNLFYISGKSISQNIELNNKIFSQNKNELQSETKNITKNGIKALRIEVDAFANSVIEGLMKKIERYHDLCSKEAEYIQKLYATFKILCITCFNMPQILPLVLKKKLKVGLNALPFVDFLLETLKICLPLFCQFAALMIKTNCGFKFISQGEFVPYNFIFEIQLKQKLVQLMKIQVNKSHSAYVYLPKAITFMQNYPQTNRFRLYRFVKIHNQLQQQLAKQTQKEFNSSLIKVCETYIENQSIQSFSSQHIFDILETALQKYNANSGSIDAKKLQVEQELRKIYLPTKSSSNKQNQGEHQRRSRECHTAKFKQLQQIDQVKYKTILPDLLKLKQIIPSPIKENNVPLKKAVQKGVRPTVINQEIINLCDGKLFEIEWQRIGDSNSINKVMVQKFRIFNDQIQSKQFMKDLTAFPSKTGIDLVNKSLLLNSDGIAEGDIIEESFNGESIVSSDAIIESQAQVSYQPSCQQLIKFSCKAIQQTQVFQTPSLRNSDSIVYSEIDIGQGSQGSMKLCEQDIESYKDLHHSQREEVSKDTIIDLIEDYTLNPEAIKQIVFKIKFLPVEELHRIYTQQSGEIAFVLEAELRSRGVSLPSKEEISLYEQFFIDQGKLFDKVRGGRFNEEKNLLTPRLSARFVRQWILLILKSSGQGKSIEFKRINSFLRKVMICQQNIHFFVCEALKLLSMNSDSFERNNALPFSKFHTSEWFKQVLIDSLFGAFIQQRIALPVIFYGWWSPSLEIFSPDNSKQTDSIRIIELIMQVLLTTPEKTSLFLKLTINYINSLNKATRLSFPYLPLQDSVPLNTALVEKMSNQLRVNQCSFSDNEKLLMLFNVMSYLQFVTFKEFLKVEFAKTADLIAKICDKQDQVLQHFRRLYCSQQGVELDRKAEIYWKLRKDKNLDDKNAELALSRCILTDVSSKLLETIKQNLFAFYYKREETEMKEELAYLRRKYNDARHYSEKYALEEESKEKEKRYLLWRRNLLNLIVVEDVTPALEAVAGQFLIELRKSTGLMAEIHSLFGNIGNQTPILFNICSELYKLMLAFELAKKEHEQTFHSMSVLKTLPSINSTKQTSAVRRRSSLGNHRTSAFMMTSTDLGAILKKCAQLMPSEALSFTPNDPLMGMHAKNADMETKLRLLKMENKLGEKVIEVTRQSVWMDTYPHLDENFGQHEIKINIKGQIGLDYGGVTREWANMLIKEITDPRLGLFQLNVNELALQPSRMSYLVPNHLEIFHRVGIFVGKALKQGWLLEVNFTKSFLKHMLGSTLYVEDLQDIDPDTARGLIWILKNYIGDDLGLNFTYEQFVLDQKKTFELVPGGSQIMVTQATKKEYVKKLAYTKMTENIREQSIAFMSGVEKVIPVNLLKLLNYREIGKFLSGCIQIDINQMQKHARYQGWREQDEIVQWFWQILASKSEEDKSQFLFFLTGSYRVPYSGFKDHPITITKMQGCKDYCPVAHTCFSIIDLPQYSSKASLQKMLNCAVKEGKGFTVS